MVGLVVGSAALAFVAGVGGLTQVGTKRRQAGQKRIPTSTIVLVNTPQGLCWGIIVRPGSQKALVHLQRLVRSSQTINQQVLVEYEQLRAATPCKECGGTGLDKCEGCWGPNRSGVIMVTGIFQPRHRGTCRQGRTSKPCTGCKGSGEATARSTRASA